VKIAAPPHTGATPRAEAVSARGTWNFDDREAKLLALGTSDGRTVDFDRMVRERHARGPEIVSRLQLGTGQDIVLDLGSGMGLVGEAIAPHVSQLHCCDISDVFLADCKSRLAAFRHVHCHQIAYADLSVLQGIGINKGYATLLFIHFNFYDITLYLTAINQVMATGGLFYFDFNDVGQFDLKNAEDTFNLQIPLYKENRLHWIFECMHMSSIHTIRHIAPQLGFNVLGHWSGTTCFSQCLLQKVRDF
jgi:cyclopropane fatty-acyl-phospholipid synthase-like methyltransferase